MDYRGAGTLSIVLVDGDGVRQQLLKTIGAYNGSKALFLEAGDYQMEVTADGQWGIDVTQPGD